ncbi:MAG TPA: small basic family protein [Syntrophomonadaceae bacterium]|nr:small basic family protein [Syntrophomonadaceae bacterium]
MWIMTVLFLVGGVLLGLHLPIMSYVFTKYMSIAVLAALDSVFGGIRAYQEDHFDNLIFLSGFVANTLLAAGLAYLGDLLRIELYLAAVVVFGVRIFQNLAIIRRYLLKKY